MNNYLLSEYDDNLRAIYENGFDISGDRTGVGTRCLFGLNTTIDLSSGRVPILTKRRVAYKSIIREVLWYISGSSNINDLEAMGSGIWTPWKSKEFTDKHDLPEGSGGYLYGHNLIHFGKDIKNPDDVGFNQLDYVINTLKQNPKSRQACFTFWMPGSGNNGIISDFTKPALLPACHAFYSFIASPDENGDIKNLNVAIHQRSVDTAIGLGMGNLLTGAIFLHLVAHQVGLSANKIFHSGAHCHIYHNQFDAVEEYLKRTPIDSPMMQINHHDSIYNYSDEDFEIINYQAHEKIKFEIAV